MSKKNLIEIGCFVGVHGIKGEVKLKSFTEIPENPKENKITMAIIGAIIIGFGKVTPIAKAIPKIKLA